MPTIEEMWKETKKNMREAKDLSFDKDKEILKMRANQFTDLFKYMNRATLPKKAEVEFMLGRSKSWLRTVNRAPDRKKGKK